MSPASVFLLVFVAGLLFIDYATLRKRGTRVLVIELVVFSAGGLAIAFPELTTRLAGAVGIGRGVDFVMYPLVIWLVRESILSRHMRWQESERMTDLVRVLAIQSARRRSAEDQ